MTKSTVLVTGAAGYIGSHVNQRLIKAGYQTVLLDNLSRSHQFPHSDAPYYQGNIGDTSLLEKIFTSHSIDTILHFAAYINVGESVRFPDLYYANNFSQTLQLISTAVHHGVRLFIFSSSAAIFGHPKTLTIDEQHPCHPINPYGQSKWMIEKVLTDFDQAYGLKSCSLRYFNAAGGDPEGKLKHQQVQTTNLIPIILNNLKNGIDSVNVFGTDYPTKDGTCIRDYVHIDDLASAHLLGMEQLRQTKHSSAYNLGNGQGYSVKEVIEAVSRVTGKKIQIVACERRPGDPPYLIANANKAARELLWKPTFPSLEIMIEHAWKAMNYI